MFQCSKDKHTRETATFQQSVVLLILNLLKARIGFDILRKTYFGPYGYPHRINYPSFSLKEIGNAFLVKVRYKGLIVIVQLIF